MEELSFLPQFIFFMYHRFLGYSRFTFHYYPFLFWCSYCLRFGKWEPFQSSSCVFWHILINLGALPYPVTWSRLILHFPCLIFAVSRSLQVPLVPLSGGWCSETKIWALSADSGKHVHGCMHHTHTPVKHFTYNSVYVYNFKIWVYSYTPSSNPTCLSSIPTLAMSVNTCSSSEKLGPW